MDITCDEKKVQALMERTGTAHPKDLVREALELLEWCVNHLGPEYQGIGALDRGGDRSGPFLDQMYLPILDRAKRLKQRS